MAYLKRKSDAKQKALDQFLAYQCYLIYWNQSMVIPLWNLNDKVVESNNCLM
ncbi:13812_t:CDS:1, partial [Gigaspora margarita]